MSRRFISHATVAGKNYTSKKGKIVKQWLESDEGLKAWAAKTKGVDDAGAESAVVTGAGHSGGTVTTEPFHLDVQVKDAKGHFIPTENPHTKKPTNTWHAYIATSKKNLYDIADAWWKSKGNK
ncbi:hypothetical protein OG21DRAFT_1490652 [Imleria badia]|nr:hypothetical protein OG21DRAFT_1490652 [Imleria badia]